MKEIFLIHFHISYLYRHLGAVVTTPGHESAGPGSIMAWAVGVQVTQLFIHPSWVGGLMSTWGNQGKVKK